MKSRFLSSVVCLTLITGLLSGPCWGTAPASEEAVSLAVTAEASEAAAIAFDGGSVTITGDGASLDDGIVRIESAGVYRLTGASDAARVVVSANAGEDDVTIVLDGCDLTYTEDETIYFKSARSALLMLADGSDNRIVSGVEPEESDGGDSGEDASGAAVRAKCPLTILGDGSLTVYGYINNGIASSEDISIESGSIAVTAANDGIKSGTDLTISGGTLDITSDGDGIQSDGSLTITGGSFSITTGGGADEENMRTADDFMMGIMGGMGRSSSRSGSAEAASGEPADSFQDSSADSAPGEAGASMGMGSSPEMGMPSDDWDDIWALYGEDEISRKGVKAETSLTITGGSFTLDTADDAIHSNGSILISGAGMDIRSGDDGVHSDTTLVIDGGAIVISLCYEGLEAPSLSIHDGYIDITSNDDGLNANGGMMFGPGPGGASSETDTEQSVLRITGGVLIVDAGGDGLDSNGDLYIEGGTVCVSGPASGANAALDSGERGEFIVSGGTLMAAGYSAMMESPDISEDAQLFIYYSASAYCRDGDTVTLTDEAGTVICEYSFAHSFNCAVISSPLLEAGKSYTLTMGDYSTELTLIETGYTNRRMGGMGRPGSTGWTAATGETVNMEEPGSGVSPSGEPSP